MKSLANSRIAVCFVGQSRTFRECAESINHFYSSTPAHNIQYTFFGHTWDRNDYKVLNHVGGPYGPPETAKAAGNPYSTYQHVVKDIHIPSLTTELHSRFHFADLVVEKAMEEEPFGWASIFYSTMRSNLLKQRYELQHNMMFDLVIKARYDVCYPEKLRFEDCWKGKPIEEKRLYSYLGFMNSEFYLPNINDVHYCGTSLTMDLVDSMYHSLLNKSFAKLAHIDPECNPTFDHVGPGAMIYKWATLKNIMMTHHGIQSSVYRFHALGLRDFSAIYEADRAIYL
tara:strand:- start:820 stop:1671 length:852 start_codon:yes stop_codon:yes gene_type:complete